MAGGGTIGLAFVDIVGDTSRTERQVERDMSRVVAQVGEAIRPVDITAAVDAGTESDLTRQINADIRAVSAAADAVRVDARLSDDARARLQRQLRRTTEQLRSARSELEVRVAERPVVESTVDAVQTAVRVAEATAPTIEIETHVDSDRLQRTLTGVGAAALLGAKGLGVLSAAAIGLTSAAKAAGGLVAVLEAIAPAAALAAPAIVSVGLGIGAVKLATVGVSDAIAGAFDDSDPKKFNEALKQLSPEARDFVATLHSMAPALKDVQKGVQDRAFAGLGDQLVPLSNSVLPALRAGLFDTASSFNLAARGVADTAVALGDSGVLQKAIRSAIESTRSLVNLPAIGVNVFASLAAAAGPSLEKIAAAASGAGDSLNRKVNEAFASGALQSAIEQALTVLGQLGHVLANVGTIFGSVFASADANGASLVQTLSKVTDQLVKAFASPAVQSGLQALFSTMGLISSTVAPLLGTALGVVAQALVALAPGVQTLVSALGAGLQPIIAALGPVLVAAGQAVTQLLFAVSPLLPVVGQLIAQLGPILVPILNAIAIGFQQLAPFVSELALLIGSLLTPILQQVPTVIQPLISAFVQLTQLLFPVAIQLLQALAPSLNQISQAFGEIFVALAPVLTQLVNLAVQCLQPLLPLIPPIIGFIGQLASILAGELARQIQTIVVPALRGLAQLLNGDVDGAFNTFEDVAVNVAKAVVREFVILPFKIEQAFFGLAGKLFSIGADIIGGLVRGIVNSIPNVKSALNGITRLIPDWKGPESLDRRLLTPAGRAIMAGLVTGINDGTGELRSTLHGITNMIGATSAGGIGLPTFGSAAPITSPLLPADPNAPQGGPTTVQVFLGTREIEDIIGTQIVANNRARDRVQSNGVRF